MSFLDEQFILLENQLEKAEMMKNNNLDSEQKQSEPNQENIKNQEVYEVEELDISYEEILNDVKNLKLDIGDLKLNFERQVFFNKFSILFPKDFFKFEQTQEQDQTTQDQNHGQTQNHFLIYTNYSKRINYLTYFAEGGINGSLNEMKKSIEDTMKNSKLKTVWLEEGSMLINDIPVGYCNNYNPIQKDKIFNAMIFFPVDNGQILINFNGYINVYKYWKLISKAIIETLEVVN